MKITITIALLFYNIICNAQQNATVKEYKKTFTTYPFSDPNPIPLLTAVYPYYRFDGFTDKPVQKEWKVVELENDYIKLLILPEIGGKIWAAIEKSTNQPFLYYNHAVKFRDVAMRGPWTSGGLEANFGIIGHTPNCSTPVDYTTTTNLDGSVSCTIGVLDLLSRSNWRMTINLPKDKAYFTTTSFWYNATPVSQPYYHWMNAGIKAKGNLEFIYPGTKYIGHEGDYADWPINKTNGKNISWYKENDFGGNKSYHVFGKYTDFSGVYWHNDNLGMVRFGAHDGKAGKKLWIWSLSGQGKIWEKLLTDTDGHYIELQSGRRFNQNQEKSSLTPFKQTAFAPFGTDIWQEYWYPVLKTKGFVLANEYGAFNLKQENGWLKIYFSPVQPINDTLEIKDGSRIAYRKKIQLNVLKVFTDSIRTTLNPDKITATLGVNKMVYKSEPTNNDLSRPVETPKDFDWDSAYGLYLLGRDAMDGKNYPLAENKLKEALQKDYNFLPALVKMGELLYRNMRYAEALELVKRALSIDTYDGGANYYYGLINMQLGNEADAKDGFDIATISQDYRSAAYTELGKIYLKEKNYDKAIIYTNKAIGYNIYNIEALQLQAVAYRFEHNLIKANEILGIILSYDILNHFARFEKYLLDPTDENKSQFTSFIRNELPQETYAELAIWYNNAGCKNEAEKVFLLSPPSVEATYWLSFLQHKTIDFKTINPILSFPFRSETGFVMEQLLAKQDNWLPKYQLALIYKDRNRITECKSLLNACGNEPVFAPFYAVSASIFKETDTAQISTDLKKAFAIDKQWRYYKLLAEYFINHHQNDSALKYAGDFYLSNPDNYIMGMLYAKTLLLNKQYKNADATLSKLNIIPFEGATDGRELYRETKLMQAIQEMKNKNYTKALQYANQAKEWPANLGVGKPYELDIDIRLEDWISYLCYVHTNNTHEANAMLEKIIQFNPHIENTVRNFIVANNLVTAWAFEQLHKPDRAVDWLNSQLKIYPTNKIILWSKSLYDKKDLIVLTDAEKDANMRIIDELLMLQQ